MAAHSSVVAWRIPGMGEPGGLPSMGSHRVRHDWSDLAAAMTKFVEHLWVLVGHLSIFFAEMPIQIVCPFFHWATCLFSLHIVNFFYIYSGFTSLASMWFANICKYFLPAFELSFHFIAGVIWGAKAFNLAEVPFICFCVESLLCVCVCVCFDACAFGIVSMKSLPNLRLLRFMLVFSSKSFIVLTFKFSSRIYLELIFVYGVR